MDLENRLVQYGYMRSGNHYLRALINVNFLDKHHAAWGEGSHLADTRKTKRTSRKPNQHQCVTDTSVQKELENPTLLFLYIWRDFTPVAKSMIALRGRVGVPKKMTLGVFRKTPWREITKICQAENEKWYIERNDPNNLDLKEIRHGRVGSMRHAAWDSELTPYEYWEQHVNGWLEAARSRSNIHVVKYEDLLLDLQSEMQKIAAFIGSDKIHFVDIEERVSMNPVNQRKRRCLK